MGQVIQPEGSLADPIVSTAGTSLAEIWAKKYVAQLEVDPQAELTTAPVNFSDLISREGRAQTAASLKQALRFTSAQAWSKTEALLAQEVQRQRINPGLIDPWQIAEDSLYLFEKTLEVYTEQAPPHQISVLVESGNATYSAYEKAVASFTELPTPGRLSYVIAADVGSTRKKYTAQDPRVLGFMSMQFHYTGQLLLDLLSPLERALVSSYFKVIDDHLYMPLQRSYEAAAQHEFNSPALQAVQKLLPISSAVAKSLCDRVATMYAGYHSHAGALISPAVRISSLRDVEMFQVYLCLCCLEGNIQALQQELFPLCVMLYPPLKVRWELVRHMLRFLGQEISDRLGSTHAESFRPYFRALWSMFSEDILSD